MGKITTPVDPWQRDVIVVAIETVELSGVTVALSVGYVHVVDRQVGVPEFRQIDWTRRWDGHSRWLSDDDLRQALSRSNSLRGLTVGQLKHGERPYIVHELCDRIVRVAVGTGTLIVTHQVRPAFTALLDGIEGWLDLDLPPISVLSTGVLERARMGGHRHSPGETAGRFYRRMSALRKDEPDLRRCQEELGLGECLDPNDELYGVMTTCSIYQAHMEGRLFQRPGRSA